MIRAMGGLAVLFVEAALGGASLGVLGVLACHGIDRLLAGHQHAQALPPWYRDGRGSWPA
jgi:hypothetical protein